MLIGFSEEYIVTSSFAAILAKIAETPLNGADIQLNARAPSFKSIKDAKDSSVVEVGIRDGVSQAFDKVVATAPLGWLKTNRDAFDPPLADDLLGSIDAISIGHLEKVYITFPSAFWREPTISADLDQASEIPEYTNWISPSYAQSTNPSHWPQEACDLAAFAAPNTRPTLLIYLFGDLSAYISSIVHQHHSSTSHSHETKQHALLEAFFKPYYSLLPHYDPTSPTCQPATYLATAWRYDELAGNGSYCNLQVGIDDADVHIETIQRGMPERSIWFAGEHASPFEELGTAAGAYFSGERVTSRILENYSVSGDDHA